MDAQDAEGTFERIETELAGHGLLVFGGFAPEADDRVPPLPDGRAAGSLLMVGNAGPAAWDAFSAAPEASDGRPHPMNRWSRRLLDGLAADHGGVSIGPSDGPPYPPFVAWAKRAAPVRESPLGMLIHPLYGVWHAYRGALVLPERLAFPAPKLTAYPCETCADKPCLSACPVGAFGPAGYQVDACAGHLALPAGADCMDLGCRARRACPIGRDYVYDPPQAAFHMTAFLAPRQTGKKDMGKDDKGVGGR